MASFVAHPSEEKVLADVLTGLRGQVLPSSSTPTSTGVAANSQRRTCKIKLEDSGLAGTLPPSLGDLECLEELRLSANGLQGTIPTSISRLQALRILDLSCNQMTGPASQVFALVNLEELVLTENQFEGNLLCEEVKALNKLTRLDIVGNAFDGEISPSFHSLCKLEYLHIARNRFTSRSNGFQILDFPTSMSSLIEIDMSSNKLQGIIPKSISSLRHLQILDLSENQFHGDIPESMKSLTQLMTLNLSTNNFHGELFPQVGQLPDLVDLSLSQNALSGVIPESIGELRNLRSLDLSKNHFSGRIPYSFTNLSNLVALQLSDNELSGPLPPGFGRMSSLEELDLHRCALVLDSSHLHYPLLAIVWRDPSTRLWRSHRLKRSTYLETAFKVPSRHPSAI